MGSKENQRIKPSKSMPRLYCPSYWHLLTRSRCKLRRSQHSALPERPQVQLLRDLHFLQGRNRLLEMPVFNSDTLHPTCSYVGFFQFFSQISSVIITYISLKAGLLNNIFKGMNRYS